MQSQLSPAPDMSSGELWAALCQARHSRVIRSTAKQVMEPVGHLRTNPAWCCDGHMEARHARAATIEKPEQNLLCREPERGESIKYYSDQGCARSVAGTAVVSSSRQISSSVRPRVSTPKVSTTSAAKAKLTAPRVKTPASPTAPMI
jgi:hypothetical protein